MRPSDSGDGRSGARLLTASLRSLRRQRGLQPRTLSLLACLWSSLAGPACAAPEELLLPTWEVAGAPFTIPGQLDDQSDAEGGWVSLRHALNVPDWLRDQPLELSIPLIEAPVELYVDGTRIPHHEASPGYRRALPYHWTLPAEAVADGVLELRLDVQQTWRSAAWIATIPRISPAGVRLPSSVRLDVANVYGGWLAMGVLLQVGFTCLLVFALDRRRKPYLWFGVQALSASAYPMFLVGLTVPVMGHYDLQYVSSGLIAALTASLFFTHSFFALGAVPRWLLWMMGISELANLVILDPFLNVDIAVRCVVASVTMCIVYQLSTIARLWWQRPDSRLSLALLGSAWLALAGTTWCDLLHWFLAIEPLDGMRPAAFGLALFGLFLSLLLSRAHILSLSQADELNANLSRQVAEVAAARNQLETVNRELRRQIADRSAQLFAALSLSHGRLDDGPVDLGVGTEVNGRYRVEEMLGAGAMGTVYRVTRLSDGERLAMKVTSELQGAALARLAREAHILSRLRHENVVHILDIDVATNGFMYVILELVEGASLRVFLRERGTMSVADAIPVLRQVALGLAALHEANIAHRDLKPDNVLLTPHAAGMHVKIADFGISRLDAGNHADADLEGISADPDVIGASADDGTAQLRLPRDGQMATETAVRARPSGRRVDSVGMLLDELDGDATEDAMALPVKLDEGTGRLALGTSQDRTAAVRRPRPANAPEPTPRLSTGSLRTSGTATPSSLDLTGTGALSGTPHYIAPELARSGSPNDVRADLYSFGVLAYELLVGKRPFATPIAVLLMHAQPKKLPPAPELPPEHGLLAPLVSRCLAYEPHTRPTALEVVALLDEVSPQVAVTAEAPAAPPPTTPSEPS